MPGFTAVNEEPAGTDVHVEASHKPVLAQTWRFLHLDRSALALRGVHLSLLLDGLPAMAARPHHYETSLMLEASAVSRPYSTY